ncbi:MAG: hypothetical protein RQ732_10625 [Methylophaga sp.]|nr:hypothetical protein [Methylophaga sp.]
MKPQVTIEQNTHHEQNSFAVHVEENGQNTIVDKQFHSYQAALDYILAQGWQLKREDPAGSLHVDIRFRKP